MSYKAVLFDMDGTLLDTLEDLRDSTNHVLRQMGYPERSLEEMRRFVGNGAEKQIRRAVPEGTSEEKIMEVLTAYCKPYPDMAETALKALGIAKKDAVFVGDSEVDVQTGLNAGLDVIAVSWGFRSREVVIEAGAKMIADDASELEKLILE